MIEVTTHKGRPILVLKREADDKYPFYFGIYKAKLILQHVEEIRQFVEDYGTEYDKEEINGNTKQDWGFLP